VHQPEIALDGQRVIGSEVLVRWRHPTRGDLLPSEFIAIAEESRLIIPLGTWVMRTAAAQAATWLAQGSVDTTFTVWVNISPRQLAETRFTEQVAQVLRETRLPAASLGVEITESALVEDLPATVRALGELTSLGVRVAIDDFGTGYSSLTWLQQLPLDVIKIDRSFVAGLHEGKRDAAIVQALVTLAHAVDLTVIAEGVESAPQLESLRAFGCDAAQGNYLQRPMRLTEGFGRVSAQVPAPRQQTAELIVPR
jgi:EAL domain-containing protein (putative c-di-GMP-specific phosphodiesterase class I)